LPLEFLSILVKTEDTPPVVTERVPKPMKAAALSAKVVRIAAERWRWLELEAEGGKRSAGSAGPDDIRPN
jgi:hypothetical protein